MRTGLVIQGPIDSPGFGPYEFDSSGVYGKSWIDFNAQENILEIISKASAHFDVIVISTWESSSNRDFLDSISVPGKVEIVVCPENEFLHSNLLKSKHKYHQVTSTMFGTLKLREFSCQVMAKVRTDHLLNFEILAKCVQEFQFRSVFSLGVPNLNLYELDRLTDFFFVGNTEVVVGMCEYYLSRPELHDDVHKDFFYKFADYLEPRFMDDMFFGRLNKMIFRRAYGYSHWTTIFFPLDRRLFVNFYWRGRLVNCRLNQWIRWFFLFQAKSSLGFVVKLIINCFVIFVIQRVKRPLIKPWSFLTYRWYRRKVV